MVFYRRVTFIREKEYEPEILLHNEERNTEKNINFVSFGVLGPNMSKLSFCIFTKNLFQSGNFMFVLNVLKRFSLCMYKLILMVLLITKHFFFRPFM